MSVGVENKCPSCLRGEPLGKLRGKMVHSIYYVDQSTGRTHALKGEFMRCKNYDEEMRHGAEPLGFYEFAWLPRRCRNGKLRWLTSVEHHSDGTYSLGNRAH